MINPIQCLCKFEAVLVKELREYIMEGQYSDGGRRQLRRAHNGISNERVFYKE